MKKYDQNHYDISYEKTADLFGSTPDNILESYLKEITGDNPILDVGIGQGRNAFYLAANGFTVQGIDTSSVAVESVGRNAGKLALPVKAVHCGFKDWHADAGSYSAVLLFGLIQILRWEEIYKLVELVDIWLENRGIVFVTAFTTHDPSFERYSREAKLIGRNSFSLKDYTTRTYLRSGELPDLFDGYTIIHSWEGAGAEHNHGEGPPERHAMVEGVFRKL